MLKPFALALSPLISLPLICSLLISSSVHAAEPIRVQLTVGTRRLSRVPALLFGQFLERPSWSGEDGPESAVDAEGQLPPAVLQAIAHLKPSVLRFPGGTDVDHLDWTTLVDRVPGRRGGRPPFRSRDGRTVVSGRFGYDEFFRLTNQLNTRAILVLNLRDGLSGQRTLEDAARHGAGLVAYANAPLGAPLPIGMPNWPAVRQANGQAQPWKVDYVQLGNEAWAFPKTLAPKGVDPADHYRRVLQAMVAAIRAVDPSITIIVDSRWNRRDLRNAIIREEWFRRDVRLLAIHVYRPFGKLIIAPGQQSDPPERWWYRWSGSFDALLHANRGGIGAPPAGYRWAVTEWNWNGFGYDREASARGVDWRQAAAVASATFLHGLMRQGADQVELATQSILIGKRWGIAAIKVDPSNPSSLPKLSAQAQVTGLYARHAGTESIALQLDPASRRLRTPSERGRPSMPLIEALATRSGRRITLHLINRSFDRDARIQVAGVAGTPRIEAVVRGSLDRTDAVHLQGSTLHLPAQAVAAVVFPGGR